jgi:aspartate aminotransferase
MTGWRNGWGAGPEKLVRAMTVIQSQDSSGANSIGQAATAAALASTDQRFVQQARVSYARRAAYLNTALSAIAGISLLAPQGAFFAYVNCSGLIGLVRPDGRVLASDTDVVSWLLDSEGVAVVDGPAYGLSPYFRISIATSDAVLADAAQRIARAVAALRPADSGAALEPAELETLP